MHLEQERAAGEVSEEDPPTLRQLSTEQSSEAGLQILTASDLNHEHGLQVPEE